jgi:hypothetical protein
MKKVFLCLTLLIIGLYLFADGADNNVPAKYTTEQMDRLANQFKTETGFIGDITYDLNFGRFSILRGTLPNVYASDTLSAKNSAKALIGSLQSYLKINPDQLTKWRVSPDFSVSNSYHVVGYQSVNGLGITGQPRIGFSIGKRTPCRLEISTNFVPDLNFSTSSFISEEKALEIFNSQLGKSIVEIISIDLSICNINKQGSDDLPIYRPCRVIAVYEQNCLRLYYIDAETGSILKDEDANSSY